MNRKGLGSLKAHNSAPIGLLRRVYTQHRAPFVPGSPGISDLLEPDKRYRPGQASMLASIL